MKTRNFESHLKADKSFKLADIDPRDTGGFAKDDAKALVEGGLARLQDLQVRLYAEGKWSLLIILQGMDTSGKDSLVSHVMSGINPQGCDVRSFKAPSSLDLRHDFLWRCACALPERGRIGIFNRSYYEDVLVVRVHKELLEKQNIPRACMTDDLWAERFASIRAFERHLARNGTVVLKFFLHISREEQKKRLLARIDEPKKNWKFDPGDLAERVHWDDYAHAYEDAIAHTTRDEAPWYIIPANHRWFARLAVAEIIATRLERMDPQFPSLDAQDRAGLLQARERLMKEPD